jgi:ubiquinone/menaquinone biosynthesis C-methylase UbiE
VLAVAREKQARDLVLGPRMQFIKHDVKSLDDVPELKKGSFDAILCSNAFVLFLDPQAVLKTWREFLKPGGFLVIDIPHEHNMRSGIFLERAAKRLGVENFPSNRVWIKSKESFREILEAEDFAVDDVVELQKLTDQRSTYFTVDEAEEQYDWIAKTGLTLHVMEQNPRFKEEGRQAFKEEFANAAVNGKVEIVDSLYVYLARRM